jgi:hypothetical protein
MRYNIKILRKTGFQDDIKWHSVKKYYYIVNKK